MDLCWASVQTQIFRSRTFPLSIRRINCTNCYSVPKGWEGRPIVLENRHHVSSKWLWIWGGLPKLVSTFKSQANLSIAGGCQAVSAGGGLATISELWWNLLQYSETQRKWVSNQRLSGTSATGKLFYQEFNQTYIFLIFKGWYLLFSSFFFFFTMGTTGKRWSSL